jgi:hypothetical protein
MNIAQRLDAAAASPEAVALSSEAREGANAYFDAYEDVARTTTNSGEELLRVSMDFMLVVTCQMVEPSEQYKKDAETAQEVLRRLQQSS